MTARVVLRISAIDLDPEHVTKATGLEPTLVQRRGEPQRFAKGLVHGEGAWQLKSTLPDVLDLRAHVEALVEPLEAARDALASLRATGAELVLECTVVAHDRGERVVLDHELLARLAALSVDLDLHVATE